MKSRMTLAALTALSVLLAPAPPALARQGHGDAALSDDVSRVVRGYARYTVFDDVRGQVDAGIVTLRGKVTLPYKKEEIEKLIGSLEGVKGVRNEIAVLPASAEDNELRQRIARAIYGNAAFWRYAAMPNPPIHIIVEHGRVTLTGVLQSKREVKLARSLATGLGERSLTCSLQAEER